MPSVKNIGKPCAGKPHARFDEGGQARACSLLYQYSPIKMMLALVQTHTQGWPVTAPAGRADLAQIQRRAQAKGAGR